MLNENIIVGDLIIKYQNIVDRKVYVETQSIIPELVKVRSINRGKWILWLEVESIKTKDISKARSDCFRTPTKQELLIYELEKKLPELIGLF